MKATISDASNPENLAQPRADLYVFSNPTDAMEPLLAKDARL